MYLISSSISLALLFRFGHCLGCRFGIGVGGVLFVDQLFFKQRAEQHGECAQVDDNAGDQVGNFAGEILGGQVCAANADMTDEQRREDGRCV